MTFYRTLVPLTYIRGNQVITIENPGTRIDLTPMEAASLLGQIVFDGSNEHTYPRTDVLTYDYYVLFPDQGLDKPLYFAKDTGLLYRWDADSYVPVGVPTNWDAIDSDKRDDLTVGESTMPRGNITGSGVLVTTGALTLSYFTARKTEAVTQIRTITAAQAQVGPTLSRMAVYSVDDAGNLLLVASTASNTSLWTAANTVYTSSFSASWNKLRGNRYAVGILTVGATTAPSFVGSAAIPAAEAFLNPRLSAEVTGLSDLPSTVLVANLAPVGGVLYSALLP